jgi:diacylglycerol kinase family enzyme
MIHAAVPLGILPAGTGNVLATELGLRGRTEDVIGQVGEWIPRRLPAGLLTAGGGVLQRYFLMLAGVGFDAPIIRKVDPALKKSYGTLSYWIAGLGELNRELDEFEVRLGDSTHRCSFALASRVRNYGGTVEIARHAGLFREDFGVVLFEGRKTYQYLEYLAGAFANRLDGMRGASILHAKTLEFYPAGDAPVYVQVDGELAGQLPAKIEIVPDALTLLAPPAFQG